MKHTVMKMRSAIVSVGDKVFLMRNLRKFTDRSAKNGGSHVHTERPISVCDCDNNTTAAPSFGENARRCQRTKKCLEPNVKFSNYGMIE